MGFLIFLLACGLALWVASLPWHARNAKGMARLDAERDDAGQDFALAEHPLVSILIPARNEAEILPVSLRRFLEQDYPNYEVILADDGSTDGTPEIARRLAESHPGKLRVVRIENLPPGWVGKTFALHTAFQAAHGEWILATDADIVFHPQALRAGLWTAERQKAELVSIYAFLDCVSFWEKLLLPGFALMLTTFFPIRKINDPGSSVALASGGYILMRRRLWESLGGYKAIRSEMIDDLNTARIVKHSGHRIFATLTKDLVRTRMYGDFQEVWEGLRKNAFAAHHFSVPRLLALVGGALLANLLPAVCLLYSAAALLSGEGNDDSRLWTLFALSLAQYGLSVLLHRPVVMYYGIARIFALLAPLGGTLYACIALDAMLRTVFGRGVSWKLRRYGKSSLQSKD